MILYNLFKSIIKRQQDEQQHHLFIKLIFVEIGYEVR